MLSLFAVFPWFCDTDCVNFHYVRFRWYGWNL